MSTTHHPKTCGPCDDCAEALADYATIPAYRDRLPEDDDFGRAERTFWRRFPFPAPTLAELIRHAEVFGAECVFETAEHYLSAGELAVLRVKLASVEPRHGFRDGRRFLLLGSVGRKPTKDEQRQAAEYLLEQGRTLREAADDLGFTVKHAEKVLSSNPS